METNKIHISTPLQIDLFFDQIYMGSTCGEKVKYSQDIVNIDCLSRIDDVINIISDTKKKSGNVSQYINLREWLDTTVPEEELSILSEEMIPSERLNLKDNVEWISVEVISKVSIVLFHIFPSYNNSRQKMCDIQVPIMEVFLTYQNGKFNCDWILAKFLNQSLINLKNA